jgi:hypothetical protein
MQITDMDYQSLFYKGIWFVFNVVFLIRCIMVNCAVLDSYLCLVYLMW